MRDDQIVLRGNLTATPTLRYTNTTGKAVVNLRVARNYPRDPQTGQQRPADFFDVEVWEDMAEHVAHLPKGCRVIIIGRFKADTWTSQDGTVNRGFRIVAEDVGPSARWNPVFSGYSPKAETVQAPQSATTAPVQGPLHLGEDDF